MVYIVGHNLLNQCQNTNKGVMALKKVESVICHEQFMTPTAKFADILLPACHEFERSDMHPPWLKGMYILHSNRVIDPLYECKPDLEIFTELSQRLGIEDFNPYTEEQWLRSFVERSSIPDYDEFKKNGIWRANVKEPHVAFKEQIEDPENHPFNTPSGKIEIYVKSLEDLDFEKSFYKEEILPIPNYSDPPEGPNDPLAKRYPLQLITPHHKFRTHSTFDNVAHLRALYTHDVWINPKDAETRGIVQGDNVKILNDRGIIVLRAKVTERIMPGVVKAYQGMWYEPDKDGIDRGGCVNVLIDDHPSPAGAMNFNTCLVQVEKT
jgi:anaerobic dimethyl sulfoxide reductase subunit A